MAAGTGSLEHPAQQDYERRLIQRICLDRFIFSGDCFLRKIRGLARGRISLRCQLRRGNLCQWRATLFDGHIVSQRTRQRIPPRDKLQLFSWAKIIPQMATLADRWNQEVAF